MSRRSFAPTRMTTTIGPVGQASSSCRPGRPCARRSGRGCTADRTIEAPACRRRARADARQYRRASLARPYGCRNRPRWSRRASPAVSVVGRGRPGGRVPSGARPGRRHRRPVGSRTWTRWSASRCCARVAAGNGGRTRVPSASAASMAAASIDRGGAPGLADERDQRRCSRRRAHRAGHRARPTVPAGAADGPATARAARDGKMLICCPLTLRGPSAARGGRTVTLLVKQFRCCHARQVRICSGCLSLIDFPPVTGQ